MRPFFSIIISLFNKEDFISDTISSVLNQSFTDFEIIVMNDGSTDNSLTIVENFDDVRIRVFTQKNAGASATRNNGIKKAKTDFIVLLDGDDLWEKDYLQTIYNTIEDYPEESVYATAIAHKYTNKIIKAKYHKPLKQPISIINYFRHSMKHTIITSSSIVFKKEVLTQTGWFDTSIKSGQDTDLWIRFGLHFPIVFINKVLVYYVYNSSSLSNTTLNTDSKPKYNNYLKEERSNKDLKKFLDINRCSMAILSRLYKNEKSYSFYKGFISTKNLPLQKRILLSCPRWLLILFLKLKALKGEKLYYKPL